MPLLISRPFMDVRSSRGVVHNYSPSPISQGIQPPNSYKVMEQMWKKDEVICTAFDTTVDMVTRNGYDFCPKNNNKQRYDNERNKALKTFFDLNFDEVQDNILYQMLAYGDAFLELRRTEGTVIDEIHPLETTEMEISYDAHGKIFGYYQHPTNSDQRIPFGPDDVIHFRMKWMGSRVYSETPLEPIGRVWATKQNAFNYLDQMFMNLHPELFIHLRGASKDQYEQAREIIWRAKARPGLPVTTYGSAESSTEIKEVSANFSNFDSLQNVLEYLRESVLMITRVPPVWVGVVNDSGANKSNSEAQIFSFETRIKKIQQKIQNKINRELMPKLGFSNIEYNFNPITSKDEKDTVQNAAVMKSMSVKPNAIVKYLKRNGVTDILEEDFITPEEIMELQQKSFDNSGGNQTARNLTSPSRQASDKQAKDTSGINRQGSSEAGSKKLEEMKTRSFNSYPYVFGVKK